MPPAYGAALEALSRLTPDQIGAFCSGLQAPTTQLATSSLGQLASGAVPEISEAQAVRLVEALLSLIAARERLWPEWSISELAERVARSEDLDIPDGQRDRFAAQLSSLLDIESLRIALKAQDIMTEQPNVYVGSRVLTDIRPVFGDAADDPPVEPSSLRRSRSPTSTTACSGPSFLSPWTKTTCRISSRSWHAARRRLHQHDGSWRRAISPTGTTRPRSPSLGGHRLMRTPFKAEEEKCAEGATRAKRAVRRPESVWDNTRSYRRCHHILRWRSPVVGGHGLRDSYAFQSVDAESYAADTDWDPQMVRLGPHTLPVGAGWKQAPYSTATYLWGGTFNLPVAADVSWSAVAPPKVYVLHGGAAGSDEQASLRAVFVQLADEWEEQTWAYSFVERKAMNRAYQRIIALGPQVVPLILERLAKEGPGHWYWALEVLTGSDPARGAETMSDAAESWLAWGRARGLI